MVNKTGCYTGKYISGDIYLEGYNIIHIFGEIKNEIMTILGFILLVIFSACLVGLLAKGLKSGLNIDKWSDLWNPPQA
jgi:hypothetical protein